MPRSLELQNRLPPLLAGFALVLSGADLGPGLLRFCEEANRFFRAARTTVWLHDRRSRRLVAQASTDPVRLASLQAISLEDTGSRLAQSLRQDRPRLAGARGLGPGVRDGRALTIPLRGRRRALGTVLLEGIGTRTARDAVVLEQAALVGRQLSVALEHHQLFDELLRSRRELQTTFDSIEDLVISCDRDWRVTTANAAFLTRVGRSKREVADNRLLDFVGPEAAGWMGGLELAGVHDGRALTRTFRDLVLGGTFSITVTGRFAHHGQILGTVVVARDLTAQLKLEAERESLRERLSQAGKLAALGQFVAGIAHELNNPLQAVLGHVELVRAQPGLPKSTVRDLSLVLREADRAARIVRNLLVFGRSRPLSRRRVSLNAILRRALALRSAAHRAAGIKVLRRMDETIPHVRADSLLLQQAFLNIIINAEQAFPKPETGKIQVRTYASEDGTEAIAEVTDNGPGIPAAVLSRIFEPFYTTKDVGKGTGLGLAVTYGVLQQHGGSISAANRPGGGARFTVRLPTERKVIK